jgi:hypothetical protein
VARRLYDVNEAGEICLPLEINERER